MEADGIEPNLMMLNVLINALGTAGKYLEALSIYHHMEGIVGFIFSARMKCRSLVSQLDKILDWCWINM